MVSHQKNMCKHIRSKNGTQTRDKCVGNKKEMAGFISFIFLKELSWIKHCRFLSSKARIATEKIGEHIFPLCALVNESCLISHPKT